MSYGKITIILPTKNHENKIVENILTLESFLEDKYLKYQILIMSNGSTIDNKKLLESKREKAAIKVDEVDQMAAQ